MNVFGVGGGLCSFVSHICLLFIFLSRLVAGYSGPVLCTWKCPKFTTLSVHNKSQHLLGEQADIGREAAKCVRAWGKTSSTTGREKKNQKHSAEPLRDSPPASWTLCPIRERVCYCLPRDFPFIKLLPCRLHCVGWAVLLIGILKGTPTGTLRTMCMMLR